MMHAGRALRLLVCVLALAGLAACATSSSNQKTQGQSQGQTTQKPRFNLAGYSATFKQGHADGCASAGGTQRRDERLFRENADYMMGWNDGRSACK